MHTPRLPRQPSECCRTGKSCYFVLAAHLLCSHSSLVINAHCFVCSDYILLELRHTITLLHPEVIAVKLAKVCSVLQWLVPDKVNQVQLAQMSPDAVANTMILHLSSILPGLRANQCHELSKPHKSATVTPMSQAKAERLDKICATLARFEAQTSLQVKVRNLEAAVSIHNAQAIPTLFKTLCA